MCPESSSDVYFNSKRFLDNRLDEKQLDAFNVRVNGEGNMFSVGGLVKRWSHWSNSGPCEHRAVGVCDMPYVRCYYEEDYQRRTTAYVFNAATKNAEGSYNFSLDHVMFSKPYENIGLFVSMTIFTPTWTWRRALGLMRV